MSEKETPVESARVAMNFPKDLKAEIQEITGVRGMTAWVVEACQERLSGVPGETRVLGPTSELMEARKLAQLLADHLAHSEDTPIPHRVLQETELPTWLSQEEWPVWLRDGKAIAMLEKQGHRTREEILEEIGSEESLQAETEQREAESEALVTVAATPEFHETLQQASKDLFGEPKNDLFATMMAKAQELGLPMGPASSLPTPERKPDPEVEPQVGTEEAMVEAEVALSEIKVEKEELASPVTSATCGECGAELVDGECWTCMF